MKLFVLMLLLIPSVFAVELPFILTVDSTTTTVSPAVEHVYTESVSEITQESVITGAVAYDHSSSGKPWALWLILSVAGVIAAILVFRR